MMGLWGLKHVEERRQQLLYINKKAVYKVGNKELKKKTGTHVIAAATGF